MAIAKALADARCNLKDASPETINGLRLVTDELIKLFHSDYVEFSAEKFLTAISAYIRERVAD